VVRRGIDIEDERKREKEETHANTHTHAHTCAKLSALYPLREHATLPPMQK
jgi:hypothetical protein